jgi:hypothetical protein
MATRAGNAPLNTITLTAAGTGKATATAIPRNSSPALVTATGNSTVGIRLPVATGGKVFHIKNLGSGTLAVYPAGSNQINAVTAGDPISMGAYTAATFAAIDTVNWYTIPVLPS